MVKSKNVGASVRKNGFLKAAMEYRLWGQYLQPSWRWS